jgi:CHRD domain-containing protein/PEP-CTERM motif-containing protein
LRVAKISLLTCLLFGSLAYSAPISYFAVLTGPGDGTPSPGTGFGTVTVDVVAQTLLVQLSFSGLLSPTTASHIHCCTTVPFAGTAGVATTTPSFPGFPLGVTAGTFTQLFSLTDPGTYNPAFVTAEGSLANAETALVSSMATGQTYLNIHTTQFPGGEISGFLEATAPEPSTLLLAGAALASLTLVRRRRRT